MDRYFHLRISNILILVLVYCVY